MDGCCLLFVILPIDFLQVWSPTCITWLLVWYLVYLLLFCLVLNCIILVVIRLLAANCLLFFLAVNLVFYSFLSLSQKWQFLSPTLFLFYPVILSLRFKEAAWLKRRLSYFSQLVWSFTSSWYFIFLANAECLALCFFNFISLCLIFLDFQQGSWN